jgi:hypothetical protein
MAAGIAIMKMRQRKNKKTFGLTTPAVFEPVWR